MSSRIDFLAEDFLRSGFYLRNWSKTTLRTYRQGLDAFTAVVPTLIEELKKSDLDRFVIAQRERGLTPGGCNMYVRTINSFLSWLNEEGHIEERLHIKLLPSPKNAPEPFRDQDIRVILAFRPSRFTEIRLWVLIQTLVDTGIRIEEALACRRQDVDFDNMLITVTGKGSKTRKVPFTVNLRKSLFRYQQLITKREIAGDALFCTSSGLRLSYRNTHRDILTLCTRLGIKGPRVSPHTFRHFFAVSYIKNGGDIYSLSRILGHNAVSTTAIYLRSMNVEQVAKLHSQFSPLGRLSTTSAR